MTAYKITKDSTQALQIVDGDSVVLEAGVSIIDPSVLLNSRQGLVDYAGIQDSDGGDNRVTVSGTSEGFVGAWFWEGSDTVSVKSGGLIYGYNAGAEFHDGGHNDLVVAAGGEVDSFAYGVWYGAFPHDDYTSVPDAGDDAIHNSGLIEGDRRDAIHMVFGDNHIINKGTIQANLENAITFDSAVTDPRNTITNTGSIVAGHLGVAIVAGDAAMSVLNDGQIKGDIQFGAGGGHYSGTGTIVGTIFGGAGNDVLDGGSGNTSFCGGAGADHLEAGSGVNTFIYNAASDSTEGLGIDTIDGFDFSRDHIVIAGGTLTSFAHITALRELQPGEAALMQSANGAWSIVVDANGEAGYQAGADYIIKLTHPLHLPG
jgi:Ca2+-binding RTX toxin-like protein